MTGLFNCAPPSFLIADHRPNIHSPNAPYSKLVQQWIGAEHRNIQSQRLSGDHAVEGVAVLGNRTLVAISQADAAET